MRSREREFLGPRNLDTTLLYIQLERTLYQKDSDEFIVKATKDHEEIIQLIRTGFELTCQKDDILYFRKRK